MSWAGYESEELRSGVEEVKDLGDEEQQHGLAEVAEDGDHRKCHASKVAVSVTDKHSGRVPAGKRGGRRRRMRGENEKGKGRGLRGAGKRGGREM